MYKLRFNLGKGENFMKWKLTSPDGKSQYIDPAEASIVLKGCKLVNQKATAHKSVCAWIEAADAEVMARTSKFPNNPEISYNPRVTPNWVSNDRNVDGKQFGTLYTSGRKVFHMP